MGLDLLVFGNDPDDEIECVRVGMSTDFNHFRRVVQKRLDRRLGRTKFPMLMRDGVWDARWDAVEAAQLEQELSLIAAEFAKLPAERQPGIWSAVGDHERDGEATSLLESFVTIDGELFVLTFLRFTQIAQQEGGFVRTD